MIRLGKCPAVLLLSILAAACSSKGPADSTSGGPGSGAWNDANISCRTNKDCGQGETCTNNVCQLARCTDQYTSQAPMGSTHFFGLQGDLAIVADHTYVDAFESSNGTPMTSWDLSGKQALDLAGGDFDGQQEIAAAINYTSKVEIRTPKSQREFDVGILPSFLGAGDLDADGVDELVAFGTDGKISVCHVAQNKCSTTSIDAILGTQENVVGEDVTVADVDGDGYAEPVFLYKASAGDTILVWNTDAAKTSQKKYVTWTLPEHLSAIAAGDIEGKGTAEIVGLEPGVADPQYPVPARLHVMAGDGTAQGSAFDVNPAAVDVSVGDTNSDGQDEVAVLNDDSTYSNTRSIDLFEMGKSGFTGIDTTSVTSGTTASRIAIADWNGKSASAKLLSGPELVAGQTVPVSVFFFPPYNKQFSDGVSNLLVGNTKTTNKTYSDTVSLHLGLMASFSASAGVLSAKVGAYLNNDYSVTHADTVTRVIGTRDYLQADPARYGQDYGAILIANGCYQKYTYVTNDPANLVGGSGQQLSIYVPVGGQSMVLSTTRYNAMAKALGTNLPQIQVNLRVGDPSSYPVKPVTLAGKPVAGADMLFTKPPTFEISDVASVGFWMTAAKMTTNSIAKTTTVGMNAGFGVLGASIDTDVNVGVTQGYSISVGNEAIFAGSAPALPDNPSTPEDEYTLHRYSYMPYVYREHWGKSGFYVLNYVVGQ